MTSGGLVDNKGRVIGNTVKSYEIQNSVVFPGSVVQSMGSIGRSVLRKVREEVEDNRRSCW